MNIDSHQHFWKYEVTKHAWINDDMHVIRRDFDPEDLAPLLKENNIDGCVAVQADQTEEETAYLLALAQKHSFIKGVVGWIDFQSNDVSSRLEYFSSYSLLKGFRHVVQGEPKGFMLRDAFRRGIAALKSFGFTYDILIYHYQLEDAIALVKEFPDQLFVLDHIAKPSIATQEIEIWKKNIRMLALLPNVYCKLSGMVTEANWTKWKKEDFTPYLDVVLEAFGMDRVMFGSDWPVCLVAGAYPQVKALVHDYFKQFSASEQQKFWGDNAVKFYSLK
jgi:L-fuconolactonase